MSKPTRLPVRRHHADHSATITTDHGQHLVVCFVCGDELRTRYAEMAELFRGWHRERHSEGAA